MFLTIWPPICMSYTSQMYDESNSYIRLERFQTQAPPNEKFKYLIDSARRQLILT